MVSVGVGYGERTSIDVAEAAAGPREAETVALNGEEDRGMSDSDRACSWYKWRLPKAS